MWLSSVCAAATLPIAVRPGYTLSYIYSWRAVHGSVWPVSVVMNTSCLFAARGARPALPGVSSSFVVVILL